MCKWKKEKRLAADPLKKSEVSVWKLLKTKDGIWSEFGCSDTSVRKWKKEKKLATRAWREIETGVGK